MAKQNISYTYLIGWTNQDKWYYGVRFAKNCNPNDLWTTYFTSSKYVKEFVKKHGNPDIIQIRKIFVDVNKARLWESKILKKLNIINNEKWLNKTSNISFSEDCSFRPIGKIWINNGKKQKYIDEKENIPNGWSKGRLKFINSRIDYTVSIETRNKISLKNKGRKKPEAFGDNVRNFHLNRKRSEKTRKKISESKKGLALRSKIWLFWINGKIIEIENLTKYCRENELNVSCMRDVYCGRQKQHKNYKRVS